MGGGDLLARTFFEALQNAKENRPAAPEPVQNETEASSAIHFHSFSYAVFLVVVFFLGNFLLRWPALRLLLLLLASYYFYASWKLWPLLIIVFSTLVDYLACLGIDRARRRKGRGLFFLLFSLFSNLGLLFSFKYLDFAIGSLNSLLSGWSVEPLPLLGLLLPVGISFYTFQTLSYTIDVYRGQIPVERNLARFAFYVAFFPQLVAGPIVRAREFLPGLRPDLTHFAVGEMEFFSGLTLIFRGLFKKVMADFLALQLVDRFFDQPSMYTSLEGILAVYGYGLQIYGDFSGYTDIAIGSAMLLGFRLTDNFNRPYQSLSVTEFWRRWHISLGAWLRDYLYISLGGSRQRLYFNLLVTMVLGGLWHGASWNFVLWGAYHGLLLVVERRFKLDRLEGYRLLRNVLVLHLILLGWLLFRVQDLSELSRLLAVISRLDLRLPNTTWEAFIVLLLWYVQHLSPQRLREQLEARILNMPVLFKALLASGALVLLHQFATQEGRPYIYFQF
ncbi:MAG: MBOAT family protein [Spirochaetales bacterium]|nr:MBOAT family protein [Spirochaetales bacterium]